MKHLSGLTLKYLSKLERVTRGNTLAYFMPPSLMTKNRFIPSTPDLLPLIKGGSLNKGIKGDRGEKGMKGLAG